MLRYPRQQGCHRTYFYEKAYFPTTASRTRETSLSNNVALKDVTVYRCWPCCGTPRNNQADTMVQGDSFHATN